jgi:tetratricopeptide (TPR) repeat protein
MTHRSISVCMVVLACTAGCTQSSAVKNDTHTLLSRVVANSDRGEYPAALDDLNQLLKSQPASAQAFYLRGNVNYSLGDKRAALADYDAALQLDAGLLPAYVARAATQTALGNRTAALADYQIIRRLSPDDRIPNHIKDR